jgi:hypothetical protein
VAITPVLYAVHWAIDAWLGKEESAQAIAEAHP